MEFRLLGPLEVLDGDRPLALGGGKQRSLSRDAPPARERDRLRPTGLIDALWGDGRRRPPPRPSRSTSRGCARSSATAARDPRARLRPAASSRSELDLARFEQLARRGAALRSRRARAQTLRRGAGAVAGPRARRPGLRGVRAARDRAARGAALGGARGSGSRPISPRAARDELVGELEALVAEHPLRERLRWPADARALPLRAPGGGARARTAQARRELSDELGLEPSEELRQLEQAILRPGPGARPARRAGAAADAGGATATFAPARAPRRASPSALAAPRRAAGRFERAARADRRGVVGPTDARRPRRRRSAERRRGCWPPASRSRRPRSASPTPGARHRPARHPAGASTCCSMDVADSAARRRRGVGARAGAVRRRPARRGRAAPRARGRCSCRSAAPGTTGRRSSSAPGSPGHGRAAAADRRRVGRRARTDATRAACSPTRR